MSVRHVGVTVQKCTLAHTLHKEYLYVVRPKKQLLKKISVIVLKGSTKNLNDPPGMRKEVIYSDLTKRDFFYLNYNGFLWCKPNTVDDPIYNILTIKYGSIII